MKDPNALLHTFLIECRSCKRKHRMSIQNCPGCDKHQIPMPHSDEVANNCCATYECDGCEAYRDHLA